MSYRSDPEYNERLKAHNTEIAETLATMVSDVESLRRRCTLNATDQAFRALQQAEVALRRAAQVYRDDAARPLPTEPTT